MNYKLKKEEITAIVEAATTKKVSRIFRKTCTAKNMNIFPQHNLEEFIIICSADPEKEARRDPYSVAALFLHVSQGA